MAVQPVHQSGEEFMTQALGERVPIARAGRFTLYARSMSTTTLYVHDKRNGPESLPVGWLIEQWGIWSTDAGDERSAAADPVKVFEWWVDQQ
jgi:hypothetical protein